MVTDDGGARDEYPRRMHSVLEHIDRHLDEPLDLARLAAVANFSPYHFHRLFAAWMDERLGDYLSRRRLERAALMLSAQPRLPVLTVALNVGFGSGEAFARAFKAHFGASPSAWRSGPGDHRKIDQANRNDDQAHAPPDRHHGPSHHELAENPMNVRLITRAPVTVAYLRRTGAYGPGVADFWMRTVAPWMQTHGLMGRARYGISHDDPSITEPARCRYDACIEVDADFEPTAPAQRTTLPGGRYAVADFNGNATEIGAAWAHLLGRWLPSSHLQLDMRPSFEHYPVSAGYDAAKGSFECEICVPVAPL